MRSYAADTRATTSVAVISLLLVLPASPAQAQATPDTIISVCSGVSLPRSVVTSIIDPVVTGIYAPIETNLNGTLAVLTNPLLGITGLPAPLSVDVNGLRTSAASGSNIRLRAIANDGTLIGPGDPCNAQADSFILTNPKGVSIGGNAITGLGASGEEAVAGEINSIAIGNRAGTDALALGSIALGTDASVGAGGTGSIAFGRGASVTVANSVALGAGSIASRGPQAGSAGEVSVGAPGAFRQITNVADGTAASDAATVGQLQAIAAQLSNNAVQYSNSSNTSVVLAGAGGTTVSNVAAGAVTASSSDAVNGSQLFATNQLVAGNTTNITTLQGDVSQLQTDVANNSSAITNLQTSVAGNTSAITTLQTDVSNLQTNVAGNTTAITNLQSGLATTNVAVSNLQTNVGAIQTSVSSNTTAISNLQATVGGNTTAITSLQTAVAGNTTAITNLEANVAGNSSAITSLQTNVAGNTTSIANLQTSVSGNTTAITNLSIDVAGNTADIGQLEDVMLDVRADLDALAQTVADLDLGNAGPVRYSNAATPTQDNGGTPTNDVTLVGAAPGPVRVHNVAAGVVAAGSTDAVNGGQLAATNVTVAAAQQTATQALQASQNAVAYDSSARTSVTLGGSGASQAVQLRNVAAGTLGTDAVNLNQVRDLADTALRSANNYTDQRLAAFSFDLGEARKEARAGAAAALAAAGMPQAMDAGANMLAAGVGTYGGKTAIAIGGSHRTENGKAVFRIGVTYDSNSKVGASGGAGIQF
ncbi:autotransporter adhesin [Sphingomonas kaistensis]|uniref:Autotransporter adhesin n=1 Tax=Sphingomonas kaistensis TaxID=298708 RepID=A0A7X6BFB9_9SPHN|nr:YadA-like family protein [Sphingomonas kaistensis]NJC04643.1 autotransporter adhesin [Sphingomonas kaistensis]